MAERVRRVPEQQLPDRESLRLQRHLTSIADVLNRLLVERLIPLLPELLPEPREDGSHLDQGDALGDLLRQIFILFGEVLESQRSQTGISRVGRLVDRVNRGQVQRQFQFAIGLDISDTEPFVSGRVDEFVSRNVGLIRNMGAEELAKIERLVTEAQIQGARVEVVAEQIRERTGVIERRAKLIARDQVNKLNAQLTRDRQTAVGVTEYRWRTSRDSRVRGSNGGTTFGPDSGATGHAVLEGTIQRWDDPPVTNPRGDKNHPGQDVQCRCTAEPVLDDLLRRPVQQ